MTHYLKALSLALCVFALVLTGCRDAESGANADLVRQIDAVDAALEAGDTEKLIELSTPDALLDAMVTTDPSLSAMEADEAKEMVRSMAAMAMAMVEIEDHDIDSSKITYFTTPSGAEAARIPTSMTMTAMGQRIISAGDMIAIRRDGEWILLNPSDEQTIAMMRSAFPELEGVEIEPASMVMSDQG